MWVLTVIICGIDYSMTSPAITIHNGNEWKYENCKFFFIAKRAKQVLDNGVLCSKLYPVYNCDAERYDNLAKWTVDHLTKNNVSKAFIEGYSFGSTGRVFQIAENGGVLKHTLWENKIPQQVFAPSEIKKFACGKGSASKEILYDVFKEETSVDLRDVLSVNGTNDWNPISDIVDSYFIAKLGFVKEKERENHS